MAKLANRKHLKKCLALLGSLVILGLLFHKIGVKNLLNEIVKVNPWAVLTAFVFYNISQLLSSLRLYMLMNCKTHTTKTLTAKIYYRSMFFSVILPLSVGADAYKLWLFVKKFKMNVKTASFIVIWERIIGVLALFSVLFILWNLQWDMNDFVPQSFSIFIIFCIASVLYLLAPKVFFGIDLRSNIRAYLSSLLIHFCQITCYLSLASCLLPREDLIKAAILFLASSLGAFVPFSFSGLGAREAVFVMGGKYFDMNVEALVAISLLFQVVHFSSAALGSFVNLDDDITSKQEDNAYDLELKHQERAV